MSKGTIDNTHPADSVNELRPEYDLPQLLSGGSRGKYAARYQKGVNLVLLDPDVAAAFTSAEAVNEALRLVMKMAQIPRPMSQG